MRLRQRAAEHGKILGEHKSLAAVDGAPAGDNAVTGNLVFLPAEFGRAVLDEHVEFLERALVEQELDALPCGQFPAGMLRLDAFFTAPELGAIAPPFEGVQNVLHLFPPRPLVPFSQGLAGSNTAFCEPETGFPAGNQGERGTIAGAIQREHGMNGTTTAETGAANGGVRWLLRLEGLTLFAGMTLLYAI